LNSLPILSRWFADGVLDMGVTVLDVLTISPMELLFGVTLRFGIFRFSWLKMLLS
jgi:hypothetical protein